MDRWIETIYEHSPTTVQHAMISLYGWKLARLRYGGGYKKYVSELAHSERYSDRELAELQDTRLRALISHSYEQVPYYARLFREMRLSPGDFRTTADLVKLPILSKETVRTQSQAFYARNFLGGHCELVSTSGTTGKTLRIRVDAEGRRRNFAFFGRLRFWAGIDPSARIATFGGRTIVPIRAKRPPFWRHNIASKALLFSSYHLSEKTIPAYLEKLRSWDPQLLDGYPSSMETVARFILDHSKQGPRPHAVITSSETLRPDQRAFIERAFNTRVFDQYGSAEQVCFISQCEAGSYHVHPEYGVTEFVPDSPSDPETKFRVVSTGFTNMAMPLLRYDTGDVAVPSDRTCICGRNFPVVEEITGRVDDLIITPDGRRVGRLDPVFKGLGTIQRAQIIQETGNRIKCAWCPAMAILIVISIVFAMNSKKDLAMTLNTSLSKCKTFPWGLEGNSAP